MAKNAKQQAELINLFGAYNIRLGKLYAKFVKELSSLGYDKDVLADNPLFNFNNFPELRERLNDIFVDFVQNNMLVLQDGIKAGTALAFAQDASNLKGFTIFNDEAINRVRVIAARSFLNSRLGSEHGLSLSDRVWNYAQHAKAEFEIAISNVITEGLKHGTSAEELSRLVRQQLKDPDMMYRRYHLKVVQSDGTKKDVAIWYRRVIDEDGKIHFVQAPLEEVGTGTYRSARKNAVRLMRTEINASYHNANTERWRLEPFVLGIRIWGSPEHPKPDICDDLWGDYPKDIDFAGFHPQCLCAAAPILCSKEERDEIIRRMQNGEDLSGYVSPNAIKEVPDNFKKYIEEHHDKIKKQFERGTASWFFRDNTKHFAHMFSEDERNKMGITLPKVKTKRIKTEAEKKLIQQRWDERKKQNAIAIKTYENVLKVAGNYPEVDTKLLQELAGKYDIAQLRLETKNVARQIVAINQQRKILIKTVGNVWQVAQDYKEVDISSLMAVYKAKDFAAMSTEVKAVAKQIAAINKQAKALSDIIPDAKAWLSQFSTAELQQVKDVVQNNITKWTDKYLTDSYLKAKYATLEDYLKYKLGDEAKYVVDATYLKPHTLYPTSKVAESAYLNQISLIQHGIEMKTIAAEIAEIKQWSLAHPMSKNVANLLHDAESLFAADKDMAALKQKVADAKAEVEKREKEQARRDRKKGKVSGKQPGELWSGGKLPFSQDELNKLADYEKKIIDAIFAGKGADDYLIAQYHDYVLQLSEKYYSKQLSQYTAAENKALKDVVKKYLSRPNENPNYIWGATLGGKYDDRGYYHKIVDYLNQGILKGLNGNELSVIQRFTNGSTFSNCYNLFKESPYWNNKFSGKLRSYTSGKYSEVKHVFEIIEEWSKSANYVLDKMVRYNGVTFRGLDGGGGPELRAALTKAFKSGKPWVNNASCSTSMKHEVARRFDSDLIMIIHNRTGAYIHAISEYSSEYEIMTLRGAKYRVLRAPVKIKGRYYCELEEIL